MSGANTPLVLHSIHHLVIGGMENGLVNLVNQLPPQKYRHAILCIEDYSDFRRRIRRPDVEVIPLFRSKVGVWSMRREIYRVCRRLRPSILHSRNLSGLDAIVPARWAGVPHIVHGEHGWNLGDLDGSNRKTALLRKLHAPFVDRFITVSHHLGNYMTTRVGVSARRVSRICNGVDTETFSPGEPAVDLLPSDFRGEHKIVIGTVGRLRPVKDQATLIRAFARLVEREENRDRLRLMVIGDGPMLAELRRLVDDLGLADLAWLPGSSRRIVDLLRAMDVFVLPSLAEGISNTLLEAMACGLPVVGSEVGGTPELIEAGSHGFLFPAGDVESLARILSQYADDGNERRRHGERARARAIREFSLETMVAGYARTYDDLLAGG